jgi:hypothetical protein
MFPKNLEHITEYYLEKERLGDFKRFCRNETKSKSSYGVFNQHYR